MEDMKENIRKSIQEEFQKILFRCGLNNVVGEAKSLFEMRFPDFKIKNFSSGRIGNSVYVHCNISHPDFKDLMIIVNITFEDQEG